VALRIVFMGTPLCAAPSLHKLVAAGHELLVVCQPDRQKGRGRKVAAPPVKECAEGAALSLLQPDSVNEPEALAEIRAFEPDLYCVVAFAQLLKAETLSVPRLGAVNLHFSLLPRWRGAAPVQHAIWAGDTVTGVTTQYMAVSLDKGDVILQAQCPITDDLTAGELQEQLAGLGADVLCETVRLVEVGEAPRHPQDADLVTWAKKIEPEHGQVDLTQPARQVLRHIHALNPSPGCFTGFRGETVKLWRAALAPGEGSGPGEVVGVEGDGLVVGTGEGLVALREVQPAGRGRQSGRDFANGKRIAPGERLGLSS
jgi:methionyl-tRNA formyltransferase